MDADRVEASRHDPLLRLDQMIYRQDQMIAWQKEMIRLIRIIGIELAILIVIGLVILIFSLKL